MESITLQTSDSSVVVNDILGRLGFAASSESDGGDSVLVAAVIKAVAEETFNVTSNGTSIVFATASSSSATDKLKITSDGHFVPVSGQSCNVGSSTYPFANVYSDAFIKSGGTSSQFLKADGSVDGSTYAKSAGVGNYAAWFQNTGGGNDITYYGSNTKDNIYVSTDMYFQSKYGMRFLTDAPVFGSAIERLKFDSSTGEAVFNDEAKNYDFRVEGQTDSDLLLVDANLDIVQIGKLNINGAFTFPTVDGSAGQSLVTDGAGTVSWSGVSGGGGTDTNDYVDSISFNTSDGVLTLGRTGALSDLTVDLDGRYSTTDNDTTYTDGSGLSLVGTTFHANVDNTTQSVAPNSVSSTASRTYAVQVDSNDKLVVNVPWVDTDTDTTIPLSGQMTGDIDMNNYDIVGTGNITIDGNITAEYFYGDLDGVVVTECRNGTASTISEGTPVYVSGYYSSNGKPLIAEANASSSSTMPAIGLLASDLASGAEGHVHVFGLAQNLPSGVTDGFSVGETVYVAAGGGLTNVRPTGVSELVQNMGRVLKIGDNGRILVLGPGRSNDVPNSGHFEQLTVDGQTILAKDGGSVGIGTASPSSKLELVGAGSTSDSGILRISDPSSGGTTSWIKLYAEDSSGFDPPLTWHIAYSDLTFFRDLEFRTSFSSVPEVTISQSGTLSVEANGTSTKRFKAYDFYGTTYNTAALPAYTFANDLDTGMWLASANNLCFSTAGLERLRIDTEKLDVNGSIKTRTGGIGHEDDGCYVTYPGGGSLKNINSTQTGYLKITLPVSWTNTMISFDIDVYEYAVQKIKKFRVGGYTYSVSTQWINESAMMDSDNDFAKYKVHFGHDGTNCAIYISEIDSNNTDLGSSTTWSYAQVSISNIFTGYSNTTMANWADGWAVGFTTTLGTTTGSIEVSRPYRQHDNNYVFSYTDGQGLDLVKSTDSTDGLHFGDKAYSTSNAYQGIKHLGMTGSQDYMMISESLHTLISAKATTGSVWIRGGGNYSANQIRVYPSTLGPNNASIEIDGRSVSEIVVNQLGNNVDFRVEGDEYENLLFTDASADRVGIKTSSPDRDFHVDGETHLDGNTIIGTGIPSLGYRLTVDGNAQIDQLNINGSFTFPTTDGSAGQSLVTDGNGNVAWSGVSGGSGSTSLATISVTSSQSLFNMTDSYSSGGLAVYLNGIKLVSGDDFTETSSTSFTLSSPAASGDIVEYVAYGSTVASTNLQKTGDTMTGNLTVNADLIVKGYKETHVDNGNTGTSQTISISNSTIQTYTLTGNCTFTMPTADAGRSFTMFLKTGAGSYTASFTNVKWPQNSAPTITASGTRMDILTFYSDGTNWYGNVAQDYYL